jgi:methyl-accepting chemotaxis protein
MGLTTHRNYRLFLYLNTFAIVLLGAAIAGFGVFWLFPANLGESFHSVQAAVRELGKVLFWRVAILYAVISLLIVLAIVVLHLLYSHRIAGPAYRLGREAERIAHGDLTGSIKCRPKDNLTEMADALCAVVSQYRGRINAVKDGLASIERQSAAVSGLLQRGKSGAALREATEDIVSSVKKIEQSLSKVRTS